MHSNQSQWLAEEIIDTRKLQLFALKEFMTQLGYEYSEYKAHPARFESKKFSNKGRNVVSFKRAVDLYNGKSVKCVFGKPPSTLSIWSFDDHTIAKAKASRILRSLKLQYCKQTKVVVVQDHRVQFCLESYKGLFLTNKHLG